MVDDSLVGVVARGQLRASLEALRGVLAERLAQAEPKESAAIARVLADVLVKLDALPAEKRSGVDELRAARAKRRSKVAKRAGGGVERGPGGG